MNLASNTAQRATPPRPSLSPVSQGPLRDAERGTVDLDLELRHAGRRRVQIGYEIIGPTSASAVLVAGGISADRHVVASSDFPESGWWDAQVGEGRPLDPARQRILAIDWLGADGHLDAPIDPADQADAVAGVLDALGIDCLRAFVGCSYGAMVGLQLAAAHPSRLQHLVAISGTHRTHPWSSAWRALQRRAVALGALQCDQTHGLELARQLAILSYRTPEEFAQRFDQAQVVDGRVRVGAEDYLDHCGASYAAKTPACAFLRLSESIDLQALAPEQVRVPVSVVAVAEDRLIPLEDAFDLVERLAGDSRLHVLRSPYGHDAFLKETADIADVLRGALLDRCAQASQVAA